MNPEPSTPPQAEYNVALSGDEARLLMITLTQSMVRVPASMAISLYYKLNEISFAQPPK